jgi:hypothetical protein
LNPLDFRAIPARAQAEKMTFLSQEETEHLHHLLDKRVTPSVIAPAKTQ